MLRRSGVRLSDLGDDGRSYFRPFLLPEIPPRDVVGSKKDLIMKSKMFLTALAVFVFFGSAGLADLFGMADVSGYLKSQGETFKAEYRAEQTADKMTETTVITKENVTAE